MKLARLPDSTEGNLNAGAGRFAVLLWRVLLVLLCLGLLSSVAIADQLDTKLPGMFEQLENAAGPGDAEQIESGIWLTWLSTDDEESDELMKRIVASMGNQDLDKALSAANELVELNPDFAEAWNKRATVYYLMGDLNSSVENIHRTLQLEPRHFGAISGLGLIFMRKGNLSAALEAFQQVLRISPQSLNARRSVEQVRKQIGEEI